MFSFKQFVIDDSLTAMKVGTDGVLLGAWAPGGSRILDVGTGSGLIAIMMAQRFPESEVTAIDIDGDACRQTRTNADNSPFGDRIKVEHQSLQDFSRSYKGELFDAIVSNPPYFQNSLKPSEQKRALARHDDTLNVRDLISSSKVLLKDGGTLSVIGPYGVKDNIESEALICGFTVKNILLLKTKLNKPITRFMIVLEKGYSETFEEQQETLLDKEGNRSNWYYELTKDFYIK